MPQVLSDQWEVGKFSCSVVFHAAAVMYGQVVLPHTLSVSII